MRKKIKIVLLVGLTIFIGIVVLCWVGIKAIQKEIVLSDTYPENGLYNEFSISPNEEWIAFSYFNKRKGKIYLAKKDGEVKMLAEPEEGCHYINPIFFDNGQKLLFLSSSYEDELKQAIYVINIDGTGIERLTPDDELVTDAVISQNGEKIYYIKAGEFYGEHPGEAAVPHEYDLYSMDFDGSNDKRVTDFSTEFMHDLSISADGNKLGMILYPYDKNDNLINTDIRNTKNEEEYVVYDITTQTFTAHSLPLEVGRYEVVPLLAPDGMKVTFNHDQIADDEYWDYELEEMDLDTQEITPVSSLDIQSKVYVDQNTLYIIYDKDEYEPNQDLRLAKINTDGSGFTEIFIFNEIMD